MKKCKTIGILGLLLMISMQGIRAQGATTESIVAYIKTYANLAISEMQRTGVPASIKIAQGLLETGAGKSDLVQRSNNHFGIKCKSSWTGEKVYHNDDEEGECFRKYESAEISYQDHSNYLASQPRYAFLFDYDQNDHTAWAWGLKKAGYATSPVYAQTLIKYIEAYALNDLNNIARNRKERDLNDFYTKIESATAPMFSANNRPDQGPVLASNPSEKVNLQSSNTVSTKQKEPRRKRGKHRSVYVVKKGDSLSSIAKKYKVSIAAIKSTNRLKKDNLQVGQSIKIPKKTT